VKWISKLSLQCCEKGGGRPARVARGNFSAVLFIQCIKAMEVKNLPIEDSYFEKQKEDTEEV
jgi:hypothetical protein